MEGLSVITDPPSVMFLPLQSLFDKDYEMQTTWERHPLLKMNECKYTQLSQVHVREGVYSGRMCRKQAKTHPHRAVMLSF